MRYSLSELEFQKLRDEAKNAKEHYNEVVADLCRRVANCEPVTEIRDHKGNVLPRGCIQDDERPYCCDCVVEDLCTYERKDYPK